MHIPFYGLKTALKSVLGMALEIADYPVNHPARILRHEAALETAAFVKATMAGARAFYSERQLMAFALTLMPPDGHCLEFGVYRGGSARFIAGRIAPRQLHGFDSFEGLPEDWQGGNMAAGTFDLHGRLPRVPGNCRLHKGRFDKSLPPWLEAHPGPIAFVHVDCDLYQSARCVFDLIGDRLEDGAVIVFDEFFNYPGWREHEFRAFNELVEARSFNVTWLGYAHSQVAVRVKCPV